MPDDDDDAVYPAAPDEVAPRSPGPEGDQGVLFDRTVVARRHEGPIPDPATIREYNDVSPGMGDRIAHEWMATVQVAREIQQSDANIRATESKAEIDQARHGQAIAGTLTFMCVITAIVLLSLGHITAGALILSGPLLLLIGQFIPGRRD